MKLSNGLAILLTLAGLAAAGEGVIWDGADGVGKCRTGGYWWSFADHDNTSFSNFPGTSAEYDSVGAWVAKNGGIMDVTFTLKYSVNGYAYYGIGFDFLAKEADFPQTWDQICLDYSLTGTAPIQLQLKNWSELTHDNDYYVKIPTHKTSSKTCFAREDFAQPDLNRTDNTIFPIDTLMSVMHGIKIEATAGKIDPKTPLVSQLKLKSITTISPDDAVRKVGFRQRTFLAQSGRVLSFSGVGNGSAKIELIDTHGRIVSADQMVSGQTMDVRTLPTGIYIARVQSGKDSYSQRIALP